MSQCHPWVSGNIGEREEDRSAGYKGALGSGKKSGRVDDGLMMVSLCHLDLVIVMSVSRFKKDTWETYKGWTGWKGNTLTSFEQVLGARDESCFPAHTTVACRKVHFEPSLVHHHNGFWDSLNLQNMRIFSENDHQQCLYVDPHRCKSWKLEMFRPEKITFPTVPPKEAALVTLRQLDGMPQWLMQRMKDPRNAQGH